MAEKIGSVDMKYIDRAKNERRFIYTSWKTGDIMLSDVSKGGGGKPLDAKVLNERKVFNDQIDTRRKQMSGERKSIRKDMYRAGSKGDADTLKSLKARLDKLDQERKALKKRYIPKAKKK